MELKVLEAKVQKVLEVKVLEAKVQKVLEAKVLGKVVSKVRVFPAGNGDIWVGPAPSGPTQEA